MKAAFLLLLYLTAVPALAQIDCEVGIWFDDGGWIRGIDAESGSTVHAYVVLAPEDGPLQLTGFLQMLDADNTDGAWAEVRGAGVNTHTPWGGGDLTLDVVWETPFVVDGPTVVADLYIPVGTGIITLFATCDVFGETTGGWVDWQHCTYCDEMPPQMTRAAQINGGVPVDLDSASWSAVKSLYR